MSDLETVYQEFRKQCGDIISQKNVSIKLSPGQDDPLSKIRDQFAGFAFQMLIVKHPPEILSSPTHDSHAMFIARGAYSYADAMMKVRKGETK